MNNSIGRKSRPARHWAIPLLAFSLFISLVAFAERKPVFWLFVAGTLIAAVNVWTNLGNRRFFALDEFFGAQDGGTASRAAFWVSMGLTAAVAFFLILNLADFAGLTTKPSAGVFPTADERLNGARLIEGEEPRTGDGATTSPYMADLLWKHDELNDIAEAVGHKAKEIGAALQDPSIDANRKQKLMRRLDLLDDANAIIACRLSDQPLSICSVRGPYIEDSDEWNRVFTRLKMDSRELLAPL